ncbi:ABC transporter permease [Metabacillus fastidiosus]|uniref:ABC transporter permease n=1 Tax=Metabacillus fastidiosus TaxID=1458 RepID=UPI003D285760
MTGRQLFNKRLIEELRFQSGIIRSVVDCTIALYIVIPALVAAVMIYKEAWQNISLYWHGDLPFSLLLVLVFLFSLSSNFRTYIMEADLLYVIQRGKLLYGLKLHAFIFSIMLTMFQVIILFMLLKSFLRNKASVFAYLQITMITFSAIIIVPILLKWIIFICSIFFIHYWLYHLYRKMLDSPFFCYCSN